MRFTAPVGDAMRVCDGYNTSACAQPSQSVKNGCRIGDLFHHLVCFHLDDYECHCPRLARRISKELLVLQKGRGVCRDNNLRGGDP